MDEEFKLAQELAVGHLYRRYNEITDLLTRTDPMSAEFIDLMTESSEINRQLFNYQMDQSKQILGHE